MKHRGRSRVQVEVGKKKAAYWEFLSFCPREAGPCRPTHSPPGPPGSPCWLKVFGCGQKLFAGLLSLFLRDLPVVVDSLFFALSSRHTSSRAPRPPLRPGVVHTGGLLSPAEESVTGFYVWHVHSLTHSQGGSLNCFFFFFNFPFMKNHCLEHEETKTVTL